MENTIKNSLEDLRVSGDTSIIEDSPKRFILDLRNG